MIGNNQKTFTVSEKVTVEKVSFKNRYGITVTADMYLAKDTDKSQKYPAIIVGTPYGGVKEQGAGIYAHAMAERGFAAIAFDESYNGESGGEPRHVHITRTSLLRISARRGQYRNPPVLWIETKLGVIGICGSGGFAITAAQVDRKN
jgi:fermentation-respiration switch protein FrsA (DUF1100 family)